MALTINEQPAGEYIQPGWNKLQYLVNSTNTTQSGFKVVCKVYINPAGDNTLVQTFNLEKVPSTTKVFVGVQDVIQSYINDNYSILNGSSTGFQSQTLLSVKLEFQEYYDDSVQGSTLDSDTIFISRSSFSRKQWIDSLYENWQIQSDATDDNYSMFLNGFSNNLQVVGGLEPSPGSSENYKLLRPGQQEQLRFFRDIKTDTLPGIYLECYFFNESFVKTKSNFIIMTPTKGDMYSFDIGMDEIGLHSWSDPDSMVPTSADKYMTLHFHNAGLNKTLTMAKTFQFGSDSCTGFTSYEVHWLNRYGGFDSWIFTGKSKINRIVNQATFKNEATGIIGDSFDEKTSKRFEQPFFTKLVDSYTLNTQNLKEWEYAGLMDLKYSPEVYIKIDGSFYSVVLKDNSVVRNHRTEEGGVYNMAIKVNIDNSESRQW